MKFYVLYFVILILSSKIYSKESPQEQKEQEKQDNFSKLNNNMLVPSTSQSQLQQSHSSEKKPFLSDNYKEFRKTCSANCEVCDMEAKRCVKCPRGTYSYKEGCYEYCPGDTYADNGSFSCQPYANSPMYQKAYTKSRCVNQCGKIFTDCSCNPRCMKTGDCCSDYKVCEMISESYTTITSIANCKFASRDRTLCLQCKEDFYLYNNSCLVSCPKNTVIMEVNNICLDPEKNQKCEDKNCEECVFSSRCTRCLNGYFLNDGKCLKNCPIGLRANRIDFTCKEKKDFSFYWIYPSKNTCKENCGHHSLHNDCSCRHTCLRRGNCCEDFEMECLNEMGKEECKLCKECHNKTCYICRNNAELRDGKCSCKSGYEYDVEEDICIGNDEHQNGKNSTHISRSKEDDRDEESKSSNLDLPKITGDSNVKRPHFRLGQIVEAEDINNPDKEVGKEKENTNEYSFDKLKNGVDFKPSKLTYGKVDDEETEEGKKDTLGDYFAKEDFKKDLIKSLVTLFDGKNKTMNVFIKGNLNVNVFRNSTNFTVINGGNDFSTKTVVDNEQKKNLISVTVNGETESENSLKANTKAPLNAVLDVVIKHNNSSSNESDNNLKNNTKAPLNALLDVVIIKHNNSSSNVSEVSIKQPLNSSFTGSKNNTTIKAQVTKTPAQNTTVKNAISENEIEIVNSIRTKDIIGIDKIGSHFAVNVKNTSTQNNSSLVNKTHHSVGSFTNSSNHNLSVHNLESEKGVKLVVELKNTTHNESSVTNPNYNNVTHASQEANEHKQHNHSVPIVKPTSDINGNFFTFDDEKENSNIEILKAAIQKSIGGLDVKASLSAAPITSKSSSPVTSQNKTVKNISHQLQKHKNTTNSSKAPLLKNVTNVNHTQHNKKHEKLEGNPTGKETNVDESNHTKYHKKHTNLSKNTTKKTSKNNSADGSLTNNSKIRPKEFIIKVNSYNISNITKALAKIIFNNKHKHKDLNSGHNMESKTHSIQVHLPSHLNSTIHYNNTNTTSNSSVSYPPNNTTNSSYSNTNDFKNELQNLEVKVVEIAKESLIKMLYKNSTVEHSKLNNEDHKEVVTNYDFSKDDDSDLLKIVSEGKSNLSSLNNTNTTSNEKQEVKVYVFSEENTSEHIKEKENIKKILNQIEKSMNNNTNIVITNIKVQGKNASITTNDQNLSNKMKSTLSTTAKIPSQIKVTVSVNSKHTNNTKNVSKNKTKKEVSGKTSQSNITNVLHVHKHEKNKTHTFKQHNQTTKSAENITKHHHSHHKLKNDSNSKGTHKQSQSFTNKSSESNLTKFPQKATNNTNKTENLANNANVISHVPTTVSVTKENNKSQQGTKANTAEKPENPVNEQLKTIRELKIKIKTMNEVNSMISKSKIPQKVNITSNETHAKVHTLIQVASLNNTNKNDSYKASVINPTPFNTQKLIIVNLNKTLNLMKKKINKTNLNSSNNDQKKFEIQQSRGINITSKTNKTTKNNETSFVTNNKTGTSQFINYCKDDILCDDCDSFNGFCVTCTKNAIYNSKEKKCACSNKYYLEKSNSTCIKCNDKCKTCSGPSANQCLTCKKHAKFDNSTNICKCIESHYYSDILKKCISKAFRYKVDSHTRNLSNYNMTTKSCNEGYYWENITNECLKRNSTKELRFVQVIYIDGLTINDHKEFDGNNLLNLNSNGESNSFSNDIKVRDSYLYGRYFHQKYSKLHKLISKKFKPKEILLESDQDSTRLVSAYSLSLGMLSELRKRDLKNFLEKNVSNEHQSHHQIPRAKNSLDTIIKSESLLSVSKNKSDSIDSSTRKLSSDQQEQNLAKLSVRYKMKEKEFREQKNLLKSLNNKQKYYNENIEETINLLSRKFEVVPKRTSLENSIPILPIHSDKNINNNIFQLEGILACKGVDKIITGNKQRRKEQIDYYINDYKNNTKIDYLLNDKNTVINYENLLRIAQEYLHYIVSNRIKTPYNNTLIDFFKNLTEFDANGILFGDEYHFLTRIISTVTMDKMLQKFDSLISMDNKALFEALNNFKKTGQIDLNLLENKETKLSISVIDKDTFIGLLIFLKHFTKKVIDMPFAPSSFQFEIYKDKKILDVNAFLEGNKNFYESINNASLDKLDKFSTIKLHEHDNAIKLEGIVNNPSLWRVKIYYNQEKIYSSTYKEFKDKLKETALDKEVISDFCLGKRNDLFFTISIILITLIGFLILSLVCIHMICLKN